MAKNPFLSAYLSAANKVTNTVLGKARSQARKQTRQQQSAITDAWVAAVTPKPARRRRSR